MNKKNTYKGMIMVMFAGMIFGAFPIFTSLYVLYGGTTDSFNFYGFLISTIMVVPIILYRKTGFFLPKKMFAFTLLAAAANTITRILLTYSYQYLNVGVATTLHFLYPLNTALLSFIFFKDKMPVYKWITFVVASLSVSLFMSDSSGSSNIVLGIVLAVASSLGFASYLLIEEKANVSEVDPFIVMFWVSLVGTIGCMFMGLGKGSVFQPIPKEAIVVLLLCAVFNNIVAFILQLLGVKHLGATMAAIISLFEPIFSCIFGAIFLGEAMGAKSILGIILILGSLVTMILLDNRKELGEAKNE